MDTLQVVLSVLNAVHSILGSALNLLVYIVILKNEELQNGLDLLIGNLCFADLAVCAIAQPMYVAYLSNKLSKDLETAFQYLGLIAMHAVVINLLCIAVNRMLAIAHPIYQHSYLLEVQGFDGHLWDLDIFHLYCCLSQHQTWQGVFSLFPHPDHYVFSSLLHENILDCKETTTTDQHSDGIRQP